MENLELIPQIEPLSSKVKLKCFLYCTDKIYSPIKIQPKEKRIVEIQCNPEDVLSKSNSTMSTKIESLEKSEKKDEVEPQEKFEKYLGRKRTIPCPNKFFEKFVKNKIDSKIVVCLKKTRGRKARKNIKPYLFISHSKYSDDNIMKKIKCNYYESLRNWMNCLLNEGKEDFIEKTGFLKLNKNDISNIRKDYNLSLLDKTIEEIFSADINDKYVHHEKDCNKKLIEKIKKEAKENSSYKNNYLNVISVLNLKYREALKIYIGCIDDNIRNKIKKETLEKFNNINYFLEKIRKQESEQKGIGETFAEDYVRKIFELCSCYEDWFIKKHKRSRKNKDAFI